MENGMGNLEQDIINYIELGKLVTDIEAQFSRITIGDLHLNLQLLERFPFGTLSDSTLELRNNILLELYGMMGKAFYQACQLIIAKEQPLILEAVNDCLLKLNKVIDDNKKYIKRSTLMIPELEQRYNLALEKCVIRNMPNLKEQLIRLKSLLFV